MPVLRPSFLCHATSGHTSSLTSLWASPPRGGDGKGGGNSNNNNKNLSNSERERRDEENRRKQRKDDVIINKTSAKRGAKDYPLDPKATQEEWLRQASSVEQQVFQFTEQGMEALNSLKLEEADAAFAQVFELKPNAYCWQAGIVKFYLDDLIGAADIFARCATIFEAKRFGGPASEERIWRDACELKVLSDLPKSRRKELVESGQGVGTVLARIEDPADHSQDDDNDDDLFMSMTTESRKVIRLTRDLFSSAVERDPAGQVVAQAKLRSIGGPFKDVQNDRKMRKLTAWFYLGLHHDVMGEKEESKQCMKMALQLSSSQGKSSDIVQTLPLLHMAARDWFDDDEYDQNPLTSPMGFATDQEDGDGTDSAASSVSSQKPLSGQVYNTDPVVEASIMEGVSKMKYDELREALRIRGLSTKGSKATLTDRLFYSLMDDAGYQSGFAP